MHPVAVGVPGVGERRNGVRIKKRARAKRS